MTSRRPPVRAETLSAAAWCVRLRGRRGATFEYRVEVSATPDRARLAAIREARLRAAADTGAPSYSFALLSAERVEQRGRCGRRQGTS